MSGVVGAAQQDVRWSVPQRHHLVGVRLCWDRLRSSQTWNKHTHVSLKPHHHCLYTDSDYICILTAKINVSILRKDHDSHGLKRHFKYFLGVALQTEWLCCPEFTEEVILSLVVEVRRVSVILPNCTEQIHVSGSSSKSRRKKESVVLCVVNRLKQF